MNKQSKRFEAIEHTADVGLHVYGGDLSELFTNAAVGLLRFMVRTEREEAKSEVSIELSEDNREELLVAWLNEIIFYVATRNFIPQKITIGSISEYALVARVRGEPFASSKHRILTEIKAATYHELEIKNTPDGFEARVIFDT